MKRSAGVAALFGCVLALACVPPPTASLAPAPVQRRIELQGPAALSPAEISGMEWLGDELWLLPQCPGAISAPVPCAAHVLPGSAVRGYLAATDPAPLAPDPVPVDWSALQGRVSGSQGFEAIAFARGRVYLTVETGTGTRMGGYLASGVVTAPPRRLVLDSLVPVPLPPAAECDRPSSWACNKSMEALLVAGDRLLVLFEVNDERFVGSPVARVFDLDLRPLGTLPMEPLELRVTDATAADRAGRFWVGNYHFPSDNLCSPGAAEAECPGVVERVVELRVTRDGVRRTNTPPRDLLGVTPQGRNWEGVARLGDAGLLLVTDDFPRPTTILCFVPLASGSAATEDRCR